LVATKIIAAMKQPQFPSMVEIPFVGRSPEGHLVQNMTLGKIENIEIHIRQLRNVSEVMEYSDSLLTELYQSEILEKMAGPQCAFFFWALYRTKKEMENKLLAEEPALNSSKKISNAIRNFITGSNGINSKFESFLKKCRRGFKIDKIIEISGISLFLKANVPWYRIYDMNNSNLQKLIQKIQHTSANINETPVTPRSSSNAPENDRLVQVSRKDIEETQDERDSASDRESLTNMVSNKRQESIADDPVLPPRKKKRLNEKLSQNQSTNPFRHQVESSISDQVSPKGNEETIDERNSVSGTPSSTNSSSIETQKLNSDDAVISVRKRKRMNENLSQKQSINPFRQPVKYS
jgi:hypothetical protein